MSEGKAVVFIIITEAGNEKMVKMEYSKIICWPFFKTEERHEFSDCRLILSSMQHKLKEIPTHTHWCRGRALKTKGNHKSFVREQHSRL